VLIDPFLTGNPVAPYSPADIPDPDVILVSHAAWDHLGDAAAIARRSGAPVMCPADVAEKLYEDGVPAAQVRSSIWGVCYSFGALVVRPVECHHWSSVQLRDGRIVSGVPLSFIFDAEPGVRIYHFGDSTIFPGMRMIGELYRPTVGILGCAQTDGLPDPGAGAVLTGEMNPDEAALAAEWLGVDTVLATHYIHPGPEVEELRRRVPAHDTSGKRVVVALRGGEELSVAPVDRELPSLTWGRTSTDWDHRHAPSMASGPITG